MVKWLFIFLSVISVHNGFAQTKSVNAPVEAKLEPVEVEAQTDSREVVERFDGTYRFIFTKGVKQAFADEIYTVIEKNRKEDEEVILTLSPYCKVQILPAKKIRSEGFRPFDKSYVFEINTEGEGE